MPISSIKTKDRLETCKIDLIYINYWSIRFRFWFYVPSQGNAVLISSNGKNSMLSAGTGSPQWAKYKIKPIWRMNTDFPEALGPTITKIRLFKVESKWFDTYFYYFMDFSTNKCLPPEINILLLLFNLGMQRFIPLIAALNPM